MSAVTQDQVRFEDAFEKLVWPLTPYVTTTALEHADEDSDMYQATDYIVTGKHGKSRLAVRCQECKSAYNTFTVRMQRVYAPDTPTEWHKLVRGIGPEHHLHAYINEGRVLSAAMCRTKDLVTAILDGRFTTNRNTRETGRAVIFAVVRWDDVKLCWASPQFPCVLN